MFRIERKIVHVAAEKIITLYKVQGYVEYENFSCAFIDAEDCAASEKWQKIIICILIIYYLLGVSVAQR
jgi:hypothetical protein